MSMTDKQKEKAARIPAIGVADEQPSHMYNKTIIADAVGSDNLQNGCKSISLNKFIDGQISQRKRGNYGRKKY
ncbi:MAG: hypothetical protein UH963_05415 [Agathobacter sp.]|nr:hypothetical protein [Agathobacter sp.]